jgi:hypothetical protein
MDDDLVHRCWAFCLLFLDMLAFDLLLVTVGWCVGLVEFGLGLSLDEFQKSLACV